MSTATLPEVRVEQTPPRRVLYLRHVGPYGSVGPTFQKLMGYAFQKGLFRPGALVMGICHDNPDQVPAENLRYDAAITVDDGVDAEGEYGIETIAGGQYAVATHRGSYEMLSQTYRGLYDGWLPKSGHQLKDAPIYEVYRNSPMDTKPDDLLTEIYLPLAAQ